MYRCKICDQVSKPGEPRRVHVVKRRVRTAAYNDLGQRVMVNREETAAEIPVCEVCENFIGRGCTIPELMRLLRPVQPQLVASN